MYYILMRIISNKHKKGPDCILHHLIPYCLLNIIFAMSGLKLSKMYLLVQFLNRVGPDIRQFRIIWHPAKKPDPAQPCNLKLV